MGVRFPLGAKSTPATETPPSKILVILLRSFGDVVAALPSIHALRDSFPKARLDLLIEPPYEQGLLGSNAHDEILPYDSNRPFSLLLDLRRRRYDWVLDFKTTSRSALLAAASGARVRSGYARIGLPHRLAYTHLYKPPRPQYKGLDYVDWVAGLSGRPRGEKEPALDFGCKIPATPAARAKRFLEESFKVRPRRLVSIAPASPTAYKLWPAERYAALIDLLDPGMETGVFLVWGRGERPFADKIAGLCSFRPSVAPESPSLLDLAALLKESDLHLGPDNGARQVAQAVGTPTVTVYGPGDPVHWTHPDGLRHRAIKKSCRCESGPATMKDRCPSLDCLMSVSVEEVLREIAASFDRIGSQSHGSLGKDGA